jgi:hypothetical protein
MPAPSRYGYHSGYRSYHRPLSSSSMGDPFAINPIRRSFGVVAFSSVVLGLGFGLGGEATRLVMVSVGWLAISALILTLPILIWSLVEEGVRLLKRRLSPHIEQLQLSARVEHILLRHGYETIRRTHEADDETLLLLSNMDPRGLREIRREINLWQYRRWQAAGFPAGGMD